MEKAIFDGTEESILKIMKILPVGNKAIRCRGNAITIPTSHGDTAHIVVKIYMEVINSEKFI